MTERREMIPVISLFSGAGSMDLGFRQSGFFPVLAIDSDASAVETYNKNFKPGTAVVRDISSMNGNDVLRLLETNAPNVRPRGVIGGPPCQSFSISNVHRKRNDPRGRLVLHYARILKELNNKYLLDFFVFENVEGLRGKRHKNKFKKFRAAFQDAGFHIYEEAVDASTFGVPQKRRRVFVVGINRDLYPNATFSFPRGEVQKAITVREAIGHLPEPAFFKKRIKLQDIPHHRNHWTMVPRSPKFKKEFSKSGRSFRKLSWGKPSWTVAYGHREIHVHPNGQRRLSVFEAMLLQGMPKWFRLRGTFSKQIEQVSNAVPPPLARALGKALYQCLYAPIRHIQKELLNWFDHNQRSFPWRETTDPYRILIAEKLLQQTSATQNVVSAFKEIITRYPKIEDLAEADLGWLKEIITPLGFTYRANELIELARSIKSLHQSVVPSQFDSLIELPGVGDYSARAVLSFGYGQDAAIVDTNIARLLHRVYGIKGELPSNPARNRLLLRSAQSLIPTGKSRDFNLAALDLCSLICTVREPSCNICPIKSVCTFNRACNALSHHPGSLNDGHSPSRKQRVVGVGAG